MKLTLKTYSIPVGYKILEDTLNLLVRVFFPFSIGYLMLFNPFLVVALVPIIVYNINFKFQREVEIKEVDGGALGMLKTWKN